MSPREEIVREEDDEEERDIVDEVEWWSAKGEVSSSSVSVAVMKLDPSSSEIVLGKSVEAYEISESEIEGAKWCDWDEEELVV